jgi:hypothetical protein
MPDRVFCESATRVSSDASVDPFAYSSSGEKKTRASPDAGSFHGILYPALAPPSPRLFLLLGPTIVSFFFSSPPPPLPPRSPWPRRFREPLHRNPRLPSSTRGCESARGPSLIQYVMCTGVEIGSGTTPRDRASGWAAFIGRPSRAIPACSCAIAHAFFRSHSAAALPWCASVFLHARPPSSLAHCATSGKRTHFVTPLVSLFRSASFRRLVTLCDYAACP